MPTIRSEGRHRPSRPPRALACSVLLAVLAWVLPACSLIGGDGEPSGSPSRVASALPAPPDVLASLERALDRRAEAVRRSDRRAFTAGLVRKAPALRRQQATYFDNLAQLPLARFAYAFDRRNVERRSDGYWVVVEVSMQLAGFDAEPVVTRDRYLFRPAPRRQARLLLASVIDEQWEAKHSPPVHPWDLGPIEVRGGYGVLGIFDAGSVPSAPALIASVERGIADVAAEVPYDWRRSVVLYALSTTAFLETIDELPGGDPARLDGLAFPIPAGTGGGRTAATRFLLHPRMLTRAGAERDRLVRHELVHVALGHRDDDAPVWLSEGIAEYVSVRPIAPERRLVPAAALDVALAGVDRLPSDESFTSGSTDPVVGYALSWWVCEYVARSFGEDTLWTLLDALGDPEVDQDRVLRDLLGLTADQLARRGARAMVTTFAPERMSPPDPSGP